MSLTPQQCHCQGMNNSKLDKLCTSCHNHDFCYNCTSQYFNEDEERVFPSRNWNTSSADAGVGRAEQPRELKSPPFSTSSDAKIHVPTNSAISDYSSQLSLAEMVSSDRCSRKGSIQDVSEDETQYSTEEIDEIEESFWNSTPVDQEQIIARSDLLKHILSPHKKSIIDRLMKKFWSIFQDDIHSIK